MSKNLIDKLFRERLSNYQEPYPEHLWEGVASGISGVSKDNRRGALWYRWLFLGAFLLLAVGSGFYLWQGSVDQSFTGSQVVQGYESNSQTGGDNGTNENRNALSAQDQLGQKEGSAVQNDNTNIEEAGRKTTTEGNEAATGGSIKSTTNNRATPVFSQRDENQKDQKEGLVQSVGILNQTGQNQNLLDGESTMDVTNADGTGENLLGQGDIVSGHTTRGKAISQGLANAWHATGQRLVSSEDENIDRLNREYLPEVNSYGKNRFIGRFGLAVVYGQDWVDRTLETKSQADLGLLNQRLSSERFVNAFTTGLELSLKVRQWTLYSGAHYSQINERVTYTIYGTERDGVIGDLERSVVNRFNMVSVPVYLGYEITRGAWALEAQAGVNIGLFMDSNGEIFDRESLRFQPYDADNEHSPYVENPGLSWHGALMLSYKTDYNKRLFLRPNVRLFNKSFTDAEYGLDQTYRSLGVMVGYRVTF